jgi:hypothetical protein
VGLLFVGVLVGVSLRCSLASVRAVISSGFILPVVVVAFGFHFSPTLNKYTLISFNVISARPKGLSCK